MNQRFWRYLRTGLALGLLAQTSATKGRLAAETTAGRREVVDETGRRLWVPTNVRRIVSLAPNLTETLYALGAEDRLAGVTDYCDYPPEARMKPHVGTPLSPSLETVVSLQPDLVLATTAINRRETVFALDRLGIPVYVTDPRTVEGLLASIVRLADLIGAEPRGRELVSSLEAKLDDLQRRLAGRSKKRVLFVVWANPLISVGPATFIADALRWAGAESVVTAQENWPRLSLEEVVRLEPQYLVVAGAHSENGANELGELRARPGWQALEAVRQGRLVVVSDAINRPAPRLVEAVEELAHALHPTAFAPRVSRQDSRRERRQGQPASRPAEAEELGCSR